jgi:peptidoglycan/xylan/chitin deacetylase (PgdA/CDA1 family)
MLNISNYHYIRENYNTKYPSIFGVTPSQFHNQLQLLKSKGDFISANDLLTNGEDILQSKDTFYLITFDDGLKEQFDYALPILDQLNVPAVLFANSRNFQDKKVSTVHKIHLLRSIISPKEFVSKINQYNDLNTIASTDIEKAQSIYIYDDKETATLKYLLNFKMDFKIQETIISAIFEKYFNEDEVLNELYMSEKQVIQLSKMGFLGSHTHNHFPIGLLEEHEIKFELQNSKQYFETLTQSKI